MKQDRFGQVVMCQQDVINLLYHRPDLDLSAVTIDHAAQYNNSIRQLQLDWPQIGQYHEPDLTLDEFDQLQQSQWFMPQEYHDFDIAAWVLAQCRTQAELQRCGKELLLYQERNLFPLLCYLKYLVDTMRSNNIVWGVGRGSSVASYVLFLIGVHRINSLYYDLDIEEFLKE